jgi:large subunit ribosomal protein L19
MAGKKAKKATDTVTDLVRRVTFAKLKKPNLPDFQVGDTVNVSVKIREGEKERVQLFKGVVIKIQNSGLGRSFTVRKMSSGVGVERTFPIVSPIIEKLEVVSRGKVRRSRLFYLRSLKGRSARLETEQYFGDSNQPGMENAEAPAEKATAPTEAKS